MGMERVTAQRDWCPWQRKVRVTQTQVSVMEHVQIPRCIVREHVFVVLKYI